MDVQMTPPFFPEARHVQDRLRRGTTGASKLHNGASRRASSNDCRFYASRNILLVHELQERKNRPWQPRSTGQSSIPCIPRKQAKSGAPCMDPATAKECNCHH